MGIAPNQIYKLRIHHQIEFGQLVKETAATHPDLKSFNKNNSQSRKIKIKVITFALKN